MNLSSSLKILDSKINKIWGAKSKISSQKWRRKTSPNLNGKWNNFKMLSLGSCKAINHSLNSSTSNSSKSHSTHSIIITLTTWVSKQWAKLKNLKWRWHKWKVNVLDSLRSTMLTVSRMRRNKLRIELSKNHQFNSLNRQDLQQSRPPSV